MRLLLSVIALSLTSCPNQAETLHRIARAAARQYAKPSNRNIRRLVRDTAARAEHLTGPQIPTPPYLDGPMLPDVTEASRRDDAATSRSLASKEGDAPRTPPPENPASSSPIFRRSHTAQEPEPGAEPMVYSIGRETQIYVAPNFDSRRLGYLRFGAAVRRTTEALPSPNCAGGWYGIQPIGYVCANGRTASIDANHPLLKAKLNQPDRMAALPYAYTIARRGAPHFYGFAPSLAGRTARARSKRLLSSFQTMQSQALPDWWRRPQPVFGLQRPNLDASLGDGLVGGGVALLGFYSDADTIYGITPDLELLTTDALEAAKPSAFSGIAFRADEGLPAAFVTTGAAWLFQGGPEAANPKPLRRLAKREVVILDPQSAESPERGWLRTKDGQWLRAEGLRIVEARTDWPDWARAGQLWVDVSINQQTLVAYEGTKAAYVTLVSTGVDGLLDPGTTKSTKLGTFRIVSKHLTATMNGEDPEGRYEMREVPWVQYFSEGYALHGAYWHDGFGQPRSHGCINLSPIDARWLFHFTSPGLPQNWHGTIPSEKTATVFVRP